MQMPFLSFSSLARFVSPFPHNFSIPPPQCFRFLSSLCWGNQPRKRRWSCHCPAWRSCRAGRGTGTKSSTAREEEREEEERGDTREEKRNEGRGKTRRKGAGRTEERMGDSQHTYMGVRMRADTQGARIQLVTTPLLYLLSSHPTPFPSSHLFPLLPRSSPPLLSDPSQQQRGQKRKRE